ncbi:hypothetical protein LMG31506_01812 [Cupriavidus yeoncheonensis]|uniref:Uncharacterized protein n=2 Tax=Cupriavidus yeoncheonensis TaxID=1462994 RepID=A0A916MUI7_9BURK|nr:hypothetical protein LMG31506_01812 [Cupriavidus yeoncheonensis]
MKRLGFRWVGGLIAAVAGAGVAWVFVTGGGVVYADGGPDEGPAPGMALSGVVHDDCDDACARGRGAAALLVLSQRPPQ